MTKIVTPNQKFWAMLQAARKGMPSKDELDISGLDPGETTGYCFFNIHTQQFELDQIETKEVVQGYLNLYARLNRDQPEKLVAEDYKVYGWKADDHKWAGLHTPQLIGAIKVLAYNRRTPLAFQMAQQAKKWATDEKLKDWGIYEPGMRHARDAQRHVITHMFFGR